VNQPKHGKQSTTTPLFLGFKVVDFGVNRKGLYETS